jgi:hypothetical protein
LRFILVVQDPVHRPQSSLPEAGWTEVYSTSKPRVSVSTVPPLPSSAITFQ